MKYTIHPSEDEALVLGEFFNRFDETDSFGFVHPAEYLALQRVGAQIDKTTPAFFDPDSADLLGAARSRIARRFQGDVPGLIPDT